MRIEKIKKVIFFVVVIVLLIISGVFLWRVYGNPNPGLGLVRFEEFTVEQTPEGKIIKHEDSGLEVTIPPDWRVVDGKDRVYLDSPNFEPDKDNSAYLLPVAKKGCVYSVSIEKSKEADFSNYQYAKDTIDWCLENPEYCEYEIIKINNKLSTKHVSSINNDMILGDHVRIETPQSENIYTFEAYLFGENREECREEFNKILETVKIK